MENKIGVVDIETAPDIAYVYGSKWEPKIVAYKQYSYIMSFSWKWLDGKQITRSVQEYKGERGLLKELHKLIDEAEMVVGWNSDKFDLKTINMRFAKYGIKPPSPIKSLDLIKTARTKFNLNSNSLDDFTKYFELKRKLDNEKGLFVECLENRPGAFTKLKRYNANDTLITEGAYKFLRPWMKHPTVGLGCPRCGSNSLQWRGYHRNLTTKYRRFQCKDCAGWGRATINEQRTKPLVSI